MIQLGDVILLGGFVFPIFVLGKLGAMGGCLGLEGYVAVYFFLQLLLAICLGLQDIADVSSLSHVKAVKLLKRVDYNPANFFLGH